MTIRYHKRFRKQYRKLDKRLQKRVDKTIERFRRNPFDPDLDNHPLKGKLKGQRSISAAFDIRIVFEEYDNYTVVIMLKVGSHEEVY